jgi:putative acetyltransferase
MMHRMTSASDAARIEIRVDDPLSPDVRGLLERHLAFAHDMTPLEHVHALDIEGLTDPALTFFAARRGGTVVGVGAIRQLDPRHGELKSMHTAEAARRTGVARAVVDHMLDVARARGYGRVSLETGAMDAFAPARALYASVGFEPCEPFGDYTRNPYSVCMAMTL